jgi:hypothetical protein
MVWTEKAAKTCEASPSLATPHPEPRPSPSAPPGTLAAGGACPAGCSRAACALRQMLPRPPARGRGRCPGLPRAPIRPEQLASMAAMLRAQASSGSAHAVALASSHAVTRDSEHSWAWIRWAGSGPRVPRNPAAQPRKDDGPVPRHATGVPLAARPAPRTRILAPVGRHADLERGRRRWSGPALVLTVESGQRARVRLPPALALARPARLSRAQGRPRPGTPLRGPVLPGRGRCAHAARRR